MLAFHLSASNRFYDLTQEVIPGLKSLCQNDVATSSHLHVCVIPQHSCRAPAQF